MTAQLEHLNFTVSDPVATAAWMEKLFGWHIRWQGVSKGVGFSVHVGTKTQYLALYAAGAPDSSGEDSYATVAGLNHIAVVVDDLDTTEAAVTSHGFVTTDHGDYEPGRRFYFKDADKIEYEVVAYP